MLQRAVERFAVRAQDDDGAPVLEHAQHARAEDAVGLFGREALRPEHEHARFGRFALVRPPVVGERDEHVEAVAADDGHAVMAGDQAAQAGGGRGADETVDGGFGFRVDRIRVHAAAETVA